MTLNLIGAAQLAARIAYSFEYKAYLNKNSISKQMFNKLNINKSIKST